MNHFNDAKTRLPDGFSLKLVTPADADKTSIINDIGQLRYAVWKHDVLAMPMPSVDALANTWLDEIDGDAYLWAIYKDGRLAASARLTVHPTMASMPDVLYCDAYKNHFPPLIASFNRLVVADEFRGLELSSILIEMRIQKSLAIGAKSIVLICPDYRVAANLKSGFGYVGAAADDPNYPRIKWAVMSKIL